MTKTMKNLAMAMAGVLTISTGVALARDDDDRGRGRGGDARRQMMLQRFDANKDGQLDEAERTKAHDELSTERFKALDKNNDGVLSLEEFKAGKGPFSHMRHGPHGADHP